MPSSLPRAWGLIVDSWNAFVKTWDQTVRQSAWLIPASLIQIAPVFVPETSSAYFPAMLVGVVAGVALGLWASIRLYKAVFALESGQKPTEKTFADVWSLILPLLWVSVLQGVATLGGLILLIIPGIYVGTRLCLAPLELLTKGTRGRAALIASWNLTKDRFWPIFGRQLLGGLVFGVGAILIMIVATLIVQLVAGEAFANTLKDETNPTGVAVSTIISSIVQAAIIPAVVIFQIKLYRALERTK